MCHFAFKTPDDFFAELIGNPLWLVFDCRESLYLLLNAFALVHQEIEGFGVFKKEAVFEHPLIVASQCSKHIPLGYEVEAAVQVGKIIDPISSRVFLGKERVLVDRHRFCNVAGGQRVRKVSGFFKANEIMKMP